MFNDHVYHFYLTATQTTLTYTQEHSQKELCQDHYWDPPSTACSVYSFLITKQEIDSIMKIISTRRDLHQVNMIHFIERKKGKKNSMPSDHSKNSIEKQQKEAKYIPLTQMRDNSRSWLDTGTLIKSGEVKLVAWAHQTDI